MVRYKAELHHQAHKSPFPRSEDLLMSSTGLRPVNSTAGGGAVTYAPPPLPQVNDDRGRCDTR